MRLERPYKIDSTTGNVSVFAILPQTSTAITHQACEGGPSVARTTGPALGNVAYDKVRNHLYISNFDDGRIYLFDAGIAVPAGGFDETDALDVFDPVGFEGLTSVDQASPYGLAVSPDGTKLYYGTHEINANPQLFAVNLAANGTFVGSEIDQNAQLVVDLQYTQDLGGVFSSSGAGGNVWVAYSDLNFSPAGELIIGLRTGCLTNFATSHNHGGAFYLLKQDAGGLYNTPADKVPGTGTTYVGPPDTTVAFTNATPAEAATRAGGGRYDAGAISIYTDKVGVGSIDSGADDGYGGIAIYDKGDGTYDYLATSSDMTVEQGPHGFMLFPHNFTLNTAATAGTNLINPLASFPSLPSSTTSNGQDYKGVGGDIEVLSVLVDWGDAPDTYSTDLISGNATGGADVKGPTHILTADGIILGTTVDFEFNGVPSVGADGDDNASAPDDEDGISAFPTLESAATTYTIPIANISAANSSGGAVTIHAWIDFDGNGVFDSDEYTTTTVASGATSPATALTWSGAGVSSLSEGTTYARFRITNDPSINATTPGGPASNGEVEDYRLDISAFVSLGSTIWEDTDADGTQDAAEPAIVGATVTLLNADGTVFDSDPVTAGVQALTDVTDADGQYNFNGIPESDFRVQVDLSTVTGGDNYIATPRQVADPDAAGPGQDNNTDSNVDTAFDPNVNDLIHTSGVVTLSVGGEPTGETDPIGAGGADQPNQGLTATDDPDNSGNMTVDMGFIKPVSLGSTAWLDSDEDGRQDAAEPGIVGATVTLLNADGTVFDNDPNTAGVQARTDTTDADGQYNFNDIPAGDYRVQIDLATATNTNSNAFIPSPTQVADPDAPGPGQDNNTDSNIDAAFDPNTADQIHTSGVITLSLGGEPTGEFDPIGAGGADQPNQGLTAANQPDVDGNMTVDFGFMEPVSLGSTVWFDSDNDGRQDAAEPAIVGATVTLLNADGTVYDSDPVTAGVQSVTDVTDGDGQYNFNNLLEGDYRVQVDLNTATSHTGGVLQATPTQVADPDAPGPGQDNNTDSNVDNTAPGHNPAGNIYQSGVVTLSVGGEPTGEFDPIGAGGSDQPNQTVVQPDTNGNMTVDFGFVVPVSLGSTIWQDSDADGIQDAAEPAIVGATITLLNANGTVFDSDPNTAGVQALTDTTDADGQYNFDGLPPGDYRVQVDLSTVANGSDLLPSPVQVADPDAAGPGQDNNTDSNVDLAFDVNTADLIHTSGVVTLGSGGEPTGETDPIGAGGADQPNQGLTATNDPDNSGNMTVDLAFVKPVSIGSTLWIDNDVDGVQDAAELGIVSATVTLLNANGTVYDSNPYVAGVQALADTTDADGQYNFDGLIPGNYRVQVNLATATNTNAGSFIPSLGQVADPDAAGPGQDNNTDSNIDEPFDPNTTDQIHTSGVITLSVGGEPTGETDPIGAGGADRPNQGLTVTNDPDNSGNMTVDFGFYEPVSLGSTVWLDSDNDGRQDAAEPAIVGVTVTLLNADGTVYDSDAVTAGVQSLTDVTDGDGQYNFNDLPQGDYRVQVDLNTATSHTGGALLATQTQVADPDAAGPGQDNNTDSNVDNTAPGHNPAGSIYQSGVVTLSIAGEPTGEFDPIGAGGADQPNQTAAQPDTNGNMAVDFGFVQPVSLGSTVFSDDNNNGTHDGSEEGISGVTVKLFVSDGSTEINVGPDGILGTGDDATGGVATDSEGDYLFTGLVPGSYVVKVTAPSVAPTSSTDIVSSTADNDIDGDDNGTQDSSGDDAVSPVIVLGVGAEPSNGAGATDEKDAGANTTGDNQDDTADANGNMTVDFGFVPAVSLGSTVFFDDDNNGTQDGSEAGISGVTVKLYASNGTTEINVGPDGILGTADDVAGGVITDSEGDYLFTGLLPGSYIVKVTAPTAAPLSSTDITSSTADNDIDGDDNGVQATSGDDAVSPLIVLAVGAEPSNGAGATDEKDTGANITGDNQDDSADANGNMTVDFGFVPSLSLGSTVFSDANNNGTHDGSETGLSGVTVKLFASNGTTEINVGPDGILGTADDAAGGVTTDSAGDYLFTGLLPDSYIIKVTPPTTAPLSSTDIASSTADNDIDGDDNGVQTASGADAVSPLIVLAVGAEPSNGAGVNDEKDTGANTTGDNQDDAIDTNGNMTIDFGFVPSLSIGSVVWDDSNSDGLQGALEPTLTGAVVTLLVDDGNGTSTFIPAIDIHGVNVDPQTTLADGLYDFNELPEGDYIVQVKPPAGYVPSPVQQVNADGNVANDSNIAAETTTLGTYESGIIELLTGDEPVEAGGLKGDDVDDADDTNGNMTVDFGFVQTASVNGRVWIDTNTNNNVDDGIGTEQGVVGVMINLIDVGLDGMVDTLDDVVVDSTTTGADGLYNFPGVTPAEYYVEFEEPTGMTFVTANEPGDDTIDSDADEITGFTDSFVLSPGQVVPNIDAGVNPGAVGDRVWLDVNQNGVQDASEPGVPGITVDLLDSTGTNLVDTTVTGNDGLYAFNSVAPDDYIIEFTIPAQMNLVPQNTGLDDSIDSDVDPNVVDKQIPVTVISGPGNQTYDAGIEPAFLGNFVWLDSNNNGEQDTNEPGIEGVTVELLASDGTTVVQTTTTDTNGEYDFAVIPDDYIIHLVAPAGVSFTTADAVADPDKDSDVAVADGKTTLISLVSGDDDQTWDAGVVPAQLSGSVFLDLNADGIEDTGEPGIDAVTITLTGTDLYGNPVLETTTTDSNGDYSFTVVPGTYTLVETDPTDFSSTGSEPGTVSSTVDSNNQLTVVVTSGDNSQENDFLDTNVALISGQVRLDSDADGDTNDADTGISGVTIELLDDQGDVIDTTVTDGSGNYSFTNVQPGDYTISETDPAGHLSTADVDGANDNTIAVTLPPGGSSTGNDYLDTVDSGVISGQVRLDADADGDLADPDAGISGVTIELLDDQGTVVDTAVTDGNGNYSFTNVQPGDYTIREVDPANHNSTADVDGASDNTIAVTLPPGGSSTGNDYLDTTSNSGGNNAGITGVVWFDTNKDGVRNPGEPSLSGWTIDIIDENGATVQTLTTQSDGTFSDLNIGIGQFTVRFLSPGGIIMKEQIITLTPGDIAFVPEPIDPSGVVYNEDTGAPIAGAQVFLTNGGVPLPSACLGAGEQGQVTGADGVYFFFLNPGADTACPATDTVYELLVFPPTGFQTSLFNQPQPGVLDSDNCTIDAIADITCEVSAQSTAPISGIPLYFILFELGAGDPGIFNNHIPLTPEGGVAPPIVGGDPAQPIPTLSEWAQILLAMLIGAMTLVNHRWRGKVVVDD